MSAAEMCMKPSNTTLSPYTVVEQISHAKEATKRPVNSVSDSQYWRFDVSQKRKRQGNTDDGRLCFKFTSTGSCSRGETCNFRHDIDAMEKYSKGSCFDFMNKGKCERGSDCNFRHSLEEEDSSVSHVRHRSENSKDSDRQSFEKNCWFCLSSPNVESHLILSIGDSYYCALAKGPLVQDHLLIIPIDHHPNTLSLAPEVEEELQTFKSALKTYFKIQGKATVFYEGFFKLGRLIHANLQTIPIPLSKACDVRGNFILAAKKMGFEFTVMKPSDQNTEGRKLLRTQLDRKMGFFYVELPEGMVLSHSIEDKEKFPVQFGREVLAGLLNMTDRVDWRNCKLSKEEEMQMAEGFKKRFEEFDPNH